MMELRKREPRIPPKKKGLTKEERKKNALEASRRFTRLGVKNEDAAEIQNWCKRNNVYIHSLLALLADACKRDVNLEAVLNSRGRRDDEEEDYILE